MRDSMCLSVLQNLSMRVDEGDGADLADGAEALADTELVDCIAKGCSSELASLIGNEVARGTEALERFSQELSDVICRGFLVKDESG